MRWRRIRWSNKTVPRLTIWETNGVYHACGDDPYCLALQNIRAVRNIVVFVTT